MAVRPAKALAGSALTWLGLQIDYDLAKEHNKSNIAVRRMVRFGDAQNLGNLWC